MTIRGLSQVSAYSLIQASRELKAVPGVYLFYNTKSDKGYVGSTLNLKKRIYEHLRTLSRGTHFNEHLQRSWQKGGEGDFVCAVLDLIPVGDLEAIRRREEFWIKFFQTTNRAYGYNVAKGTYAGRHTDATREKISIALQGRKLSAASIAQMAASKRGRPGPWLGKSRSTETKQKMKQANLGKRHTEETRRKMSLAHQGHQITAEGKQRIAAARATVAYQVTSPTGKTETIYNLTGFCRSHGLKQQAMWALSAGRRRFYLGWRCSRQEPLS